MRRLAVKSTNTLVSQVQFFKLGQDRGEPVVTYLRSRSQLQLHSEVHRLQHRHTEF